MKKLIILFILVLFLGSVSAQNISVNYPKEVQIEEEFSFKIKLIDFGEDIYDVKIDVLANGERIARILNNNEWKSTYYYVNNIISQNEEKEFFLKISDYIGVADITIKIKNSADNSEIFNGYEIEVVETPEEPEEPNEAEEEKEEEENEEEIEIEETQSSEPIYYEEIDKEEEVKLEIIKLNSKDIKTEDNTENSSKNTYAKYGFVVFCILLGFLFILKKRKNYKTEFEENENKEE